MFWLMPIRYIILFKCLMMLWIDEIEPDNFKKIFVFELYAKNGIKKSFKKDSKVVN